MKYSSFASSTQSTAQTGSSPEVTFPQTTCTLLFTGTALLASPKAFDTSAERLAFPLVWPEATNLPEKLPENSSNATGLQGFEASLGFGEFLRFQFTKPSAEDKLNSLL